MEPVKSRRAAGASEQTKEQSGLAGSRMHSAPPALVDYTRQTTRSVVACCESWLALSRELASATQTVAGLNAMQWWNAWVTPWWLRSAAAARAVRPSPSDGPRAAAAGTNGEAMFEQRVVPVRKRVSKNADKGRKAGKRAGRSRGPRASAEHRRGKP